MRTLAIAVVSVALAACAAGGVKVTDDQLTSLKAGETTKAQVLAMLGAPTMQMRLADGTSIVVYSYYEAKVRPATFIPVVGAFAGGSDSSTNTATLRFDAADRLIDTTSSSSAMGSGMGAAAGQIQPATVDQPRK
ncbi:outer membrane protein assembly factor BamE [Pseudorhodoferax sp. LjRoot39]|uniref:outer membrane protein assembly factor BamE domain-containing protein n=1 Tax=Pseudorhodoferax sp. LjRoot39 TaxID=3342328 RepID=UPI003ECD4DFE